LITSPVFLYEAITASRLPKQIVEVEEACLAELEAAHFLDLMRLAVLAGLRSLQLSVYGVTWDGIASLQKALPRLSVGRALTGPPRS